MGNMQKLLQNVIRQQDRKTAAARELPSLDPVYAPPVGWLTWLPGLRGAWPLSSYNAPSVYDVSGQGRTLTNNNGVVFSTAGLVPIATMASASSRYLSRAHETGLNPTTQFWGSIWINFSALGAQVGIMGKYLAAADFAFRLIKTSGDVIRMQVTSDGTSGTEVTHDHTASIAVDTWYQIAFRFNGAIPEMRIWVNGSAESKTSGVPATVFNATNAAFEIGRSNGSSYLNGSIASPAFGSGLLDNAHVKNFYQQTRWGFGV